MAHRGRGAALALLTTIAALSACDAPPTRVRVVHTTSTTTAIDVWVAGSLRARGIAFGDTSDWIAASPGDVVELRVGESATLSSAALSGSGDHVMATASGGMFTGAPSVAPLPAAQGRGLELVLVSAGAALTYRLEVPDRPGLVAEAASGRASSLVLPGSVSAFTLGAMPGDVSETTFVIDDAMRAAGRVLLVPVERSDGRSMSATTLLAIDPDAPRARAAWIVAPAPRVHLLLAVAGGGVALRLAGGDPVVPCRPPSCALPGAEITGGSALVELVAAGSGAVQASLDLTDLVAGERRLVVATGDADGDPALRLISLPVRPQLRGGTPVTTIVHAAGRLGPVAVSSLSSSRGGGYALLRDPLSLGEQFESSESTESGQALGFGETGGPVRGAAGLAFPTESTIVVLTSPDDSLDRAETIQLLIAEGLSGTVAPLEAP